MTFELHEGRACGFSRPDEVQILHDHELNQEVKVARSPFLILFMEGDFNRRILFLLVPLLLSWKLLVACILRLNKCQK